MTLAVLARVLKSRTVLQLEKIASWSRWSASTLGQETPLIEQLGSSVCRLGSTACGLALGADNREARHRDAG